MHLPSHNSPVKRTRAVRVGLGALAASAALAAVPSLANAATTCTNDIFKREVNVTMDGGPGRTLHIFRGAPGDDRILVGADGESAQQCGFGINLATVGNTDLVKVRNPVNPAETDSVILDESGGQFRTITQQPGHRPRVVLLTGTGGDTLQIFGSNGADNYTAAGGPLSGQVQIGGDFGTPEISMTAMGRLFINGNGGDDFINATSNVGVRAELFGGPGRDFMIGGSSGKDLLDGGPDADYVRVRNNKGGDRAIGGDGPGDHGSGDVGDTVTGFESTDGGVGKLKLAPRTVNVSSAKTGVVSLSWTHPKAWQNLRTVSLKAYDGATPLGTIKISPKSETMTGSGSLKLVKNQSSIAKKGKTVTARLAIRTKPSLAGKTLRLDVEAIDDNGTKQIETDAGELRVK